MNSPNCKKDSGPKTAGGEITSPWPDSAHQPHWQEAGCHCPDLCLVSLGRPVIGAQNTLQRSETWTPGPLTQFSHCWRPVSSSVLIKPGCLKRGSLPTFRGSRGDQDMDS